MLRLGVQVSISGKIYKAIDRIVELGCNTMQIFSRNPRSFRRKPQEKDDLDEFVKRRKKADINPLAIHAVYTLNLASYNKRFYRFSVRDFIRDMHDAHDLGAELMVTHVGSFKRSTYQDGIKRVIEALDKILKKSPPSVTLLLENISGSGHWIGSHFSELAYIIDKLGRPKNLGICLDTCHVFSAGYNLSEEEGLNNLVTEIDSLIGLDRLKLIHLNDTRDTLGSKKDRHWHIGEGQIGKEGFRRFINHPKLRTVPFILETPKKEETDDTRNIEAVRSLYDGRLA
ncbi:MAG: deoxyribonuclease IV [Candidatus Omnitrophica bacterium]|nr:deoxyribonuclease IV [Candidatus Omnitrophota bacterium]